MTADGVDIPEWGYKIHQKRWIKSSEVNQHTPLHATPLNCYHLSVSTHLIHLKLDWICLLSLQTAVSACSSRLTLEEVKMTQELTCPWTWWSNQCCSQCNSDGHSWDCSLLNSSQASQKNKKQWKSWATSQVLDWNPESLPTGKQKQNKTMIYILRFPNCNGTDLTLMPRLVVLNSTENSASVPRQLLH